MVRIDRISMQGFKSFANRTVLPFPSGFNVICGPNGSGKSCVGDAIVFVLGIRSSKSLRADNLSGLIFAGGKGREGADHAAVSLYLDNTDKSIPNEPEEIRVTRKVNKNGVSIYKINEETVNRRKVVDVLASAGIYADGHNIIMQGDVTHLIAMNAIERRTILDEVSGIAEFDDKKEKAEKELLKVDEKLKEARIVLNEKKNLLDKLQKEQDLARKYKGLQEDLATVRFSIISKKTGEAQDEINRIKDLIQAEENELAEAKKSLENLDRELEEKQKEVGSLTKEVMKGEDKKLIQELADLRSLIDKKMTQIEYNRREMSNIEGMLATLSEEVTGPAKHIIDMRRPGVHGTIGTLFTVDEKFRTAVEVAAGNRLNDIIVDTDGIAQECIEYLKKNNLGRVTFLPLSKLQPVEKSRESRGLADESGVLGFVLDVIKYDPSYDIAFRHVFSDTLILNDLQTARRYIGRAKMVTLEGELIQKAGAITGGSIGRRTDSRISSYSKMRAKLEDDNSRLNRELEELDSKMKDLKKREHESSFSQSDFEKEYDERQKAIDALRKEREGLYEKRVNIQAKISNLSIRAARIEADLKNLDAQKEGVEERKILDLPVDKLESEKKRIIEDLDKIGAVNFKAIEDYDTMKMMYEDLKKKVDVIDEERNAVLKMAEGIESQRREKFMRTFSEINTHFSDIYTNITDGGVARLELEEENNIRSGLFIRARPKGKKELSLDAMSGGEKTMTALSFLFAVQMHHPAPFYILDEVDAALDKKNTDKIAKLVVDYSKRAQFIIISHNDTMIKSADKVYGVSMENGVSKVVSLELPKE